MLSLLFVIKFIGKNKFKIKKNFIGQNLKFLGQNLVSLVMILNYVNCYPIKQSTVSFILA